MEQITIDRFRLRFPEELERTYREESFHRDLKQLRTNITVAALIYAIFGVLDAWVTPQVKVQAWFIRYAIVIPTVIAVLSFSFSPHFKRYQVWAVSILLLVGGGGIVALITITKDYAPFFHFAGLLLVFMTAYMSFKLRFLQATVLSWIIVLFYEISALWLIHPPLRVFLTDNFFYLAANLMGMFSNYQRELYMRKEFLQTRRMQEMELRKHAVEKDQLNEAVDKAVRSLRESEEKFRALAETTAASIIIHRGGRFLYANHAVQTITGYSHEELLSMDFWEIVHPEHREMVRERGRARISGQSAPEAYELKVLMKNGEERWATATAGRIEYGGEPAIIATLFDITDRKRAEEEKVKLFEDRMREEQRHHAEKENILMELHDGVGGITTNISILAEIGLKSNDLDSIKSTLSTISELSREGVSEIRSFMRGLDTAELTWRSLTAELRNQGTRILEPHAIAFTLDAAMDDLTAAQPGSLLFVGLFKIYKEALTNVIKHSGATAVSVTLNIAGDRLFIAIRDNGKGFDGAGGTGRGLMNMRKRAAELGGTLTVTSNCGTCVDVAVPISLQANSASGV